MKGNMKVCMVINNFPPAIGGAELYAQGLSERLAKEGHDISVLTRNIKTNGSYAPGSEVKNGVFIRRFRICNFPGLRFFVFFFLVTLWLFRNRSRIDIIHAYHVFSTGFMTCLIGKLLGKPIIIRDGESLNAVEDYWKNPLIKRSVRYTLEKAKTYVDNIDLLDLLGKFNGDADIKFLQNPVDTKKFSTDKNNELKKKLGLEKYTVIAYVGRLEKFKGLDFLFQAMPEVLRKSGSVKLLIVGYGPERENLESMASELGIDDDVVFTGKIPFEKVHEYYKIIDIFVQASITCETPNTLIQAMAAGKVAIATELVMQHALKNNENVIVIKRGSKDAIADAIIKLVIDKNLQSKLGRTARIHAEKRFSWKPHVSAVIKMYRSLFP